MFLEKLSRCPGSDNVRVFIFDQPTVTRRKKIFVQCKCFILFIFYVNMSHISYRNNSVINWSYLLWDCLSNQQLPSVVLLNEFNHYWTCQRLIWFRCFPCPVIVVPKRCIFAKTWVKHRSGFLIPKVRVVKIFRTYWNMLSRCVKNVFKFLLRLRRFAPICQNQIPSSQRTSQVGEIWCII